MYEELQKAKSTFYALLLYALMAGVSALFVSGCVMQIKTGQSWGNQPMSDAALVIVTGLIILFSLGMSALFYTSAMRTNVSKDGIRVHYKPWGSKRKISWEKVQEWKVARFRTLRDFGGYGVHFTRRRSMYNVVGGYGLLLKLGDKKEVLIGTQDPEGLRKAIAQYAPARARQSA